MARMYVRPQKPKPSDVEQESDAACMLSAEADHSWSMRERDRR